MTIININAEARLEYDGRQYMPFYFEKGGDLVRNVSTGEMKPKLEGWRHTGTYHTTIVAALSELAKKQALSKAEYASLSQFVSEMESNIKNMVEAVK